MGRYAELHRRSIEDPEGFWAEQARAIRWRGDWERVLDASKPPFYRWFPGGILNTCENAVDRHVDEGRGEQLALVYDSAMTGEVRRLTYRELLGEVARFAGVLARQGVGKGDRVVLYMPMVPEAVVAMLACARLGAIHCVVFGGFASPELATRIDMVEPKVVVSASCGLEPGRVVPYKPLLDAALAAASARPERCVILQRPELPCDLHHGRDVDWDEEMAAAHPVDCVPVAATDPLYVLHTSGTTGLPKGVVHDNGGHAVGLRYSMRAIYDVEPGDVYWAASDIGWVVGHSYIVYAPLLHGCTTILYEGKPVGTPDPGAFWRVLADHAVNVLFAAPTAFRAIRREDPEGQLVRGYDLSRFRTLFVAGERCDPDTLLWAQETLGVPVIDHWWQTETAWAIGANPIGIERFPTRPGSAGKPAPGYDIHVLDEEGEETRPGEIGSIVVRLPLPPASFPTLWRDDERYVESYMARHPGYYVTGDGGTIDEDGYLWVMGRIDDVINVAGHRLSTGAMEEVLASHPDVAECAVIAVPDELKGDVPLGFVVLKAGRERAEEELVRELVALVRERIGPVASFKSAAVVARLPKTRSGKILRSTMRRIAEGADPKVPATVEDAGAVDEAADALRGLGYPRAREGVSA